MVFVQMLVIQSPLPSRNHAVPKNKTHARTTDIPESDANTFPRLISPLVTALLGSLSSAVV